MQRPVSNGIQFGSISIGDADQDFHLVSQRDQMKSSLWDYGCLLERDGYELRGYVRIREEVRKDETNELTVSDKRFNPERDLVFEQTEDGYMYHFTNEEWDTPFTIRAYEGADILKHDYRIAYYEDADELTASLKSSPKKNDHPLQFSHVGRLIRAN